MDQSKHGERWCEITDENGIASLMHVFGRFHDGCIREVHIATGHFVEEDLSMTCNSATTVHMLVQRQVRNPSAIELEFEQVVELRLSPPPPDYVALISEASFSLREGVFYWSDDWRFDLESTERNDYSWIAARRVWWHTQVSGWVRPSATEGDKSNPFVLYDEWAVNSLDEHRLFVEPKVVNQSDEQEARHTHKEKTETLVVHQIVFHEGRQNLAELLF